MKPAAFGFAVLACCSSEAGTIYGTSQNNLVEIDTSVPGGNATNIAGGLNGAFGVAVDAAGNVFVGENYDVQEFSPTGTPFGVFANLQLRSPESLAFDSHGNLFVGTYGSILEFSPLGNLINTIATGNNIIGNDPNNGLAFDAAGNLYDADGFNNVIRRYSPGGAYVGSWSGGLNQPDGLAFDSAGNLYVNNYYNVGVTEFSSSGASLGTVISSQQVQYGFGLAIDSSGNFFVSVGNLPPPPGQVEGYGIKEFSSNGTYLQTIGGTDGGHIALAAVPEPFTPALSFSGLILLFVARKIASPSIHVNSRSLTA
jgi:sugar lactone lactonase YvrE